MATVNMTAVSKYHDHHCVLHDIHLNIEKGEFVVVVGPSGCGKSTLLRLVAGLDTVSSGSILINDRCVNKIPPASRDMAMVFQNYALYPHMTVYDNMAYGLKMRKMDRSLIRQRVEEVAALLQLSDYLHRKPMLLSGGQRQRVAMGRAIVRSPAVFLFDEPLSNLDAKLRTEMRYEIKKLHQQLNTTCLYVTHDQTEAMTLADRVVVLNQGRVEQVGSPRVLYESPATLFVASFIGHYPMNFLPATLDLKQGLVLSSTGLQLSLPSLDHAVVSSGHPVMIGIRPEHMHVATNMDRHVITARVEFIEDMGADRLLQLYTHDGELRFSVRLSDTPAINTSLSIGMDISKANLYCQQTGHRLGGWNG